MKVEPIRLGFADGLDMEGEGKGSDKDSSGTFSPEKGVNRGAVPCGQVLLSCPGSAEVEEAKGRREVAGGQDSPFCFMTTAIFSYFSVNYCFPPKKFLLSPGLAEFPLGF